ncbi:TolB family protein [Nonomuraea sp. NPDC003727]
MNDLEETLRSTLGHAAERAPRRLGALATQVEARHRQRRRRTQAALVAAAVAVLAGGTTFVLTGPGPAAPTLGNPRATVSAEVATPAPADRALPEPVEKVWPQAVHKLPARLPDGSRFQPVAFIDDRTVLVETQASFEKADALFAYDLETREARRLTDVPTPEGTVLFASDFTIGDGHIVWWTANKEGVAQLWSVPVTGGNAKLVAERKATVPTEERDNDAALDPPAVANGRITFSFRSGGVFRVSLDGGTTEPVPDAERLHVLKGPWIGPGGWYGPDEGVRFGEIRNVETGETRTAVTRPGERDVRCGVTSCMGLRAGGREAFVRLRDGSEERELPGGFTFHRLPARDRFHTALAGDANARGMALHDLATGTAADLGIRMGKDNSIASPQPALDERLMAYPVGDEIVVLDLSKIP